VYTTTYIDIHLHHRQGGSMSWIVVALLYVAGIGFFHWLGGIGAAADALRKWGRSGSTFGRVSSS
jgi:hypothetical protein